MMVAVVAVTKERVIAERTFGSQIAVINSAGVILSISEMSGNV
ncbi:MAG: hypothetical protein BWY05_01376 [Euryarchaeota archaeon ADurb.Bin165]|nr:MAG: hypothetical protein BWY05_01376 [Euryarchaeota archaeon ADurb.Bin165]